MTLRVRELGEGGITVARLGVARLHRHHNRPPPSGLVAFEAVGADGWPVGWAIVGRPVSHVLQAQGWVEVTRVATDGARNACSMLYGAAARWARRGGRRALTYTLVTEPGTSLRAAGWVPVARTATRPSGRRWSRRKRPREPRATDGVGKIRWVPRRDFIGPEIGPWGTP